MTSVAQDPREGAQAGHARDGDVRHEPGLGEARDAQDDQSAEVRKQGTSQDEPSFPIKFGEVRRMLIDDRGG